MYIRNVMSCTVPAFIVHPQVVALERRGTNDVRARVVGRAVFADAVRCGRLSPLSAIERRW